MDMYFTGPMKNNICKIPVILVKIPVFAVFTDLPVDTVSTGTEIPDLPRYFRCLPFLPVFYR